MKGQEGPAVDLAPLRAVLADLPPPEANIADGGSPLCQTGPDEYEMIGLRYLPVVDRLWVAFRAAGFPADGQFQYQKHLEQWVRDHPPLNPEWDMPEAAQVAIMGREDCFNLLRFIKRQERFGEGMWSAAHRIGWFHALAERLIELGEGDDAEGKKVDSGSSPE